MTQQHTPGPWEVNNNIDVVANLSGDKFGDTYVEIAHANPFGEILHSIAEANAHLISAAPDLLAALVNLEAYLRSTPHHNAVEAAAARAAIRSATGGAA